MTTASQLDLLGREKTDTAQCLRVLAACDNNALDILVGHRRVDSWEGDFPWKVNISAGWCHAARPEGYECFRYTPCSLGRPWMSRKTPIYRATWAAIDQAVADDPRLPAIRAWADTWRDTPAGWRQLERPYELWSPPDIWPPAAFAEDHAHPGWEDRLRAWQATIAILTDAADQLAQGESR